MLTNIWTIYNLVVLSVYGAKQGQRLNNFCEKKIKRENFYFKFSNLSQVDFSWLLKTFSKFSIKNKCQEGVVKFLLSKKKLKMSKKKSINKLAKN